MLALVFTLLFSLFSLFLPFSRANIHTVSSPEIDCEAFWRCTFTIAVLETIVPSDGCTVHVHM